MADVFTPQQRSRVMAAIKLRHTQPELLVRRIAHRLGYRFRLHRRDLPGTPDLVFPRLGAVVNVHGCFWHRHRCPHGQRAPATNAEFWKQKRDRNAARDVRTNRQLRRLGWRVLTIWECQMRDPERLANRLAAFLSRAIRSAAKHRRRAR